eukprot:g1477.t1
MAGKGSATAELDTATLLDDDELGANYLLSFGIPKKEVRAKKKPKNRSKGVMYSIGLLVFLISAREYGVLSVHTLVLAVLFFIAFAPRNSMDDHVQQVHEDHYVDEGSPKERWNLYPWHAVIHQFGRQPLCDEFRFLVSQVAWEDQRVNLINSFYGMYVKTIFSKADLKLLGKRVKGLCRRIVRETPFGFEKRRLRKQCLQELESGRYFEWVLENNFCYQFIEDLPGSLEKTDLAYAGANFVESPISSRAQVESFRLWFLKIFCAHIVKRYVVSIEQYPSFDTKCVICSERTIRELSDESLARSS